MKTEKLWKIVPRFGGDFYEMRHALLDSPTFKSREAATAYAMGKEHEGVKPMDPTHWQVVEFDSPVYELEDYY